MDRHRSVPSSPRVNESRWHRPDPHQESRWWRSCRGWLQNGLEPLRVQRGGKVPGQRQAEPFVSQSDVPTGVGLLQLVLDRTGLVRNLSRRFKVTLDLEGEDVSSLDPLGQESLGEVDLGAVVGQQHGNLFLATLEAVDGQADLQRAAPGEGWRYPVGCIL